ncbi:MAG: DNA/RNA nuclease SfsA [Eubacteriaceae bacterium]|nr:DNA/RNA nuclease SfsA [Eubacteriaceae bacterium]
MRYEKVCNGTFIERPNRFIAKVVIDGKEETVHVKNTGRCRELLVPGAEVYMEDFEGRMGKRKLRYSLIAVKKGNLLINMDSQAPNYVVEEALTDGRIKPPGMGKLTCIKREKTFGDSRYDFYLEDEEGRKGWMEVKGVTLEDNGICRFPDAPTQRGKKHINGLAKAVEMGYTCQVVFVIQMNGMKSFEPNDATDLDFGDALREASSCGVSVLAYDCIVEPDSLQINSQIKVEKIENIC